MINMTLQEQKIFEIKKKRKEKKINQQEMANMLGIKLETYRLMEQGKTKLTFDRYEKIMNILENDFKLYIKKTIGDEKDGK